MRFRSKRVVAFTIAVLMLVTMMPMGVWADGSTVYSSIYDKIKTLMTSADKATNVGKLYSVLNMLDTNDALATAVDTAIDSSTYKTDLMTYGFKKDAVMKIIEGTKTQFPTSISDLISGGTSNVFMKMYTNAATLGDDYSSYKTDLETVVKTIYGTFPTEFKVVLKEFDDDGAMSTIEVYSELFKVVMDEKIGNQTYTLSSGTYTRSLSLSATTKTKIKTKLAALQDGDPTETAKIALRDKVADAFFGLGDVIVKSVDSVIGAKQATTNTYKELFELLIATGMVTSTTHDDSPDEETTTPPDTTTPPAGTDTGTGTGSLDTETDTKLDDAIGTVGDSDTDQAEAVENVVNIVEDLATDAALEDNAESVLKQINTVALATVEKLNADSASEFIEQQQEVFEKGLDNLTAAEAVDLLSTQSDIIEKALEKTATDTTQQADVVEKQFEFAADIVDELTLASAEIFIDKQNDLMTKAMEVIQESQMADIANKQGEMIESAIDNENVTADKAEEFVNTLLDTNFTTVLAKMNASENEEVKAEGKEKLNKATKDVVQKAMKKRGTLKVAKRDLNVGDLAATLATAKNALATFKTKLNTKGLYGAAEALKPQINIDDADQEKTDLKFDDALMKSLTDADADLSIKSKGLEMSIPSDSLGQDKGLLVTSTPVPTSDLLGLGRNAANGIIDPLLTFDISIKSEDTAGQADIPGVMLQFNIKEVIKANPNKLYTLTVYDQAIAQWGPIFSQVKGDYISGIGPHYSKYSVAEFKPSFTDTTAHWAELHIANLSANDIIHGKDKMTFDPQGTITRAEFVQILVNLLGLEGNVTNNFYDIPKDAWYYEAVGLAGMNSLSAGSMSGNFFPEEKITRQDMAVMIARAFEIRNGFKLYDGTETKFTDHSSIVDYAVDAVYAAKSKGIITGYEDMSFKPMGNATRAEAVKMIYELIQQ